jgi:hypothetical protein
LIEKALGERRGRVVDAMPCPPFCWQKCGVEQAEVVCSVADRQDRYSFSELGGSSSDRFCERAKVTGRRQKREI